MKKPTLLHLVVPPYQGLQGGSQRCTIGPHMSPCLMPERACSRFLNVMWLVMSCHVTSRWNMFSGFSVLHESQFWAVAVQYSLLPDQIWWPMELADIFTVPQRLQWPFLVTFYVCMCWFVPSFNTSDMFIRILGAPSLPQLSPCSRPTPWDFENLSIKPLLSQRGKLDWIRHLLIVMVPELRVTCRMLCHPGEMQRRGVMENRCPVTSWDRNSVRSSCLKSGESKCQLLEFWSFWEHHRNGASKAFRASAGVLRAEGKVMDYNPSHHFGSSSSPNCSSFLILQTFLSVLVLRTVPAFCSPSESSLLTLHLTFHFGFFKLYKLFFLSVSSNCSSFLMLHTNLPFRQTIFHFWFSGYAPLFRLSKRAPLFRLSSPFLSSGTLPVVSGFTPPTVWLMHESDPSHSSRSSRSEHSSLCHLYLSHPLLFISLHAHRRNSRSPPGPRTLPDNRCMGFNRQGLSIWPLSAWICSSTSSAFLWCFENYMTFLTLNGKTATMVYCHPNKHTHVCVHVCVCKPVWYLIYIFTYNTLCHICQCVNTDFMELDPNNWLLAPERRNVYQCVISLSSWLVGCHNCVEGCFLKTACLILAAARWDKRFSTRQMFKGLQGKRKNRKNKTMRIFKSNIRISARGSQIAAKYGKRD